MKTLNKTQLNKLNSFKYTSSKIRYLDKLKFSRGEISKVLKIKYQHVRNVLITPTNNNKEKI